ncbi:MAG: helicase-related protein [Caulobacterales bacterium]
MRAVLGPTNTGKTHLAIERMLAHRSGMIGLPLRLLAREVYDKVVAQKGARAAALVTGEEKIWPDSARYLIATVEAMPLDRAVEFLAVDEIQLARDPDRGHIFTDRILRARGTGETMLLGSDTMRNMIRRHLPRAEVTTRERLSRLSYAGPKKITKLPKRTAIVAFSAEEVYAIAELIRRHRGGAAVVMGALSPRTRNAQVALYQSGEVDFLVATDAIGMGLNMDVDHVAFASYAKFDGRRNRVLRPDEIAQIAGRAGRFTRDGTFGETGECIPFDDETVVRVEEHEFETVEAIEWRNPDLDFSTIASLIASLERPPAAPGLMRARGASDEETLKRLASEDEISKRVRGKDDVRRFWEVCQTPDFRKVAIDEHARLVARLAQHLIARNGRLPADWIGREIAELDRTEGDLDVLQTRLANIRTWTYIANRADWLDDAEGWRARTREVEDRISDALHSVLQARFVDRRTSALLRSLKREDVMLAGVSEDGEVTVEGHYVGRLEGLEFRPDPRALGLEGKAVRNAAQRALAPEVARRLKRISEGEEFTLERDGRIMFDRDAVAKLIESSVLKPKVALIGAEQANDVLRKAAVQRMEDWLTQAVAYELAPLIALDSAWREGRLPHSTRGLAFRLVENGGAIDKRESGAHELTHDARVALEREGVRFGRCTVHMPALLRLRAAKLHAILRQWTRAGAQGLPYLPRHNVSAAAYDPSVGWASYAAAGFRPAGGHVVRIDRLERLAAGLSKPAIDPKLNRILRLDDKALASVLTSLGYRRIAPAEEGAAPRWRPPNPPKVPKQTAALGPFSDLAALLPSDRRS